MIEGIEDPANRFCLGAQWHPEFLIDPGDARMFARPGRRGRRAMTRPRGERIAKWLARAGVASRRDAEKLIAEGQVRLNNDVVTHPATFVVPGDLVWSDGRWWTRRNGRGCGATTSRRGW